jgi:hypothetical protein
MMVAATLLLWRARGPRFLALLVAGWIGLRLVVLAGNSDRQLPAVPPLALPPVRWDEALADPPTALALSESRVAAAARQLVPLRAVMRPALRGDGGPAAPAAPMENIWASPDRHRWRLALFTSLLPKLRHAPAGALMLAPAPAMSGGQIAAPLPVPRWPSRADDRWSLAVYSQWRSGGSAAVAGNRPPALGGSQSSARLDYRLDSAGRWRGFARLTASPLDGGQADAALGLTLRPKAALPVELHIEQRFAVAGPGRNRTLAYVAGGVDDRALGGGIRLSVYAQGGVAGPGDLEAFVDGAIMIDRPVWSQDGVELALGGIAAGAAQRGVARIDLGPRATLSLPGLGEGARVALDWRERIAGNARPGSGAVLTLSAGF